MLAEKRMGPVVGPILDVSDAVTLPWRLRPRRPVQARAAALSVASHVNPGSVRPKWPYAAVCL